MSVLELKQNIEHAKEIIREIYVFTNQYNSILSLEQGSKVTIDIKEKKLLKDAIEGLTVQLRIINNTIPVLVNNIGFFKKLDVDGKTKIIKDKIAEKTKENLVRLDYKPSDVQQNVSLTINEKDRKTFLENLSKSNLSINQLKKKYSVEKTPNDFGKPSEYAKLSNRFFRDYSNKLLEKGYLNSLNNNLRKINSQFVVGTYTSMALFSVVLGLFGGILLFILLLFFNIDFNTAIILTPVNASILERVTQVFWVIIALPLLIGALFIYYPQSEAKNLGSRINQELPFVTIHMSAIATAGIEPVKIFGIILKSEEYKYTNLEFRKLLNLINFHGYDLVNALRATARASPSAKLKELLEGIATTITSGGNLHNFLDGHSESLLFDYKLEREKYTKTAETFMNIYISIVIAAPMILMILFVVMGSSGLMFGMTSEVASLFIILVVAGINVLFLTILHLKQPVN
ncbi:MAG: type II secretion system F family protein [Candidatus Nanoarchaeia archaeon]